jgi:hypothetical protein
VFVVGAPPTNSRQAIGRFLYVFGIAGSTGCCV